MTKPETEKFWANVFRVTAIFLLVGILYYCQANIREPRPSRSPVWTVVTIMPLGEHLAFWKALETFAEDEALATRDFPLSDKWRKRSVTMYRSDVEIRGYSYPHENNGYSLSAYPYPSAESPPNLHEDLAHSLERHLHAAGFDAQAEMRK